MANANITEYYSMCRHFAEATSVKSKHINGKCWEHNRADIGYALKKTPNSKYFKTKTTMLHRFVYAVYNDTPLDKDMWIGHRCHNKKCINPQHLEIITPAENNWRNYPEVYNQKNKNTE